MKILEEFMFAPEREGESGEKRWAKPGRDGTGSQEKPDCCIE